MSVIKKIKKFFKEIDEGAGVSQIWCKLESGENHIFTNRFLLVADKNGNHYLNFDRKKVRVHGYRGSNKVDYIQGKSVGKKLLGAAALGAITGGAGAIVGAVAFGNNKTKKIRTKYLVLSIEVIEEGVIYDVTIKHSTYIQYELDKYFL